MHHNAPHTAAHTATHTATHCNTHKKMYSAFANGARTPRLMMEQNFCYTATCLYESYKTMDMCETLARLDS